jgi:hypothetical protein
MAFFVASVSSPPGQTAVLTIPETVMRRTWIGAAAAVTIASAGGSAWAQAAPGQDQAPASQQMQMDSDPNRDPPPGAENSDRRAERMQDADPMDESQRQKPAGKPSSD